MTTEKFTEVAALEGAMFRPSQALIETLAGVPGDILVLVGGGKATTSSSRRIGSGGGLRFCEQS